MPRSRASGPELVATFFGAGYAPVASGTFGSLAAMPLAAIAAWSAPWGLVLAAAVVAVGVPAATHVARDRGISDPGVVVIDEVAGMTIAALGVGITWPTLLASFLFFRLFDIWKPFPCRRLEAVPGGWGIMLDDLVAGLYALGCVHLLRIFVL